MCNNSKYGTALSKLRNDSIGSPIKQTDVLLELGKRHNINYTNKRKKKKGWRRTRTFLRILARFYVNFKKICDPSVKFEDMFQISKLNLWMR